MSRGIQGALSGPEALAAEDLHAYYGDSHVLQGVSLSVPAGQIVAVLGRNGVGKTTLIRSLLALTPPRSGRVWIGGTEVTGWPAHRLARLAVGLVPQGRRIFPSLSVREHLQIGVRPPVLEGPPAWSPDRVYTVFPRLRERIDARAATLSGGERQMLAVGRALVSNPRLLIMDEPTEGLSPHIVEELLELVRTLRAGGVSVLLVEQNLAFALGLADVIHLMDKGRVARVTTPQGLQADEALRRTYLGV